MKTKAMFYSISTLLTRNLHDVFGENDPARRRAAIDEVFTEDCVFYDPKGGYRGRDEINRIAGAVKATHPDCRYQPIGEPEEVGNGGWSNGYRAALVRRQHTLVLISSLPGTAGLPPFIFFPTNCNSPSIATLTMHANFMLIATPDKHPCVQSGSLNLAWNRFSCHGALADFGVHFQTDLACFR